MNLVWQEVLEPLYRSMDCPWRAWWEGIRYEPPAPDPRAAELARQTEERICRLQAIAESNGARLVALSRRGVFSGDEVSELHRGRDSALDEIVRLTQAALLRLRIEA